MTTPVYAQEATYRRQQSDRARLYATLTAEQRAKFDAIPDAPTYRRKERTRSNDPRVIHRRTLATRSNLPPRLGGEMTFSENAVLVVIIGEQKKHGMCDLSVKEKADRAGVRKTSVRASERLFVKMGLITKKVRPHRGRKSETSVIRIVSPELLLWMKMGIGCENAQPLKKVDRFFLRPRPDAKPKERLTTIAREHPPP